LPLGKTDTVGVNRLSSGIETESSKRESSHKDRCPECGSEALVVDRDGGEKICSRCGYVVQEVIVDRKPEWRAFNHTEIMRRSRVGAPSSPAYSDKGLHTTMGNVRRDLKGKVSNERKWQLRRLSTWQRRVTNSSDHRNLTIAMNILARLCNELHIPKGVKEQAAVIYRHSLKKNLVRGRSIENIVATSLYSACRLFKTQRSLNDICVRVNSSKKDLARSYRLLHDELNLKVPRPKAENKIAKIAGKIDIDYKIQRHAIRLLKKAEEKKITAGKAPTGLAAAALYIACKQNNDKCTQKDIAFAAGVTEVTVRNRYKGLLKGLNLEI
jgi:transcription initiation factor TFIIB